MVREFRPLGFGSERTVGWFGQNFFGFSIQNYNKKKMKNNRDFNKLLKKRRLNKQGGKYFNLEMTAFPFLHLTFQNAGRLTDKKNETVQGIRNTNCKLFKLDQIN